MNALSAFRLPTAVCLAALLGAAGPAFGQASGADPVIAVVNGTQIHASEIEVADEMVGRNIATQDKAERRDTLLKMMTDMILLAQVAKDRNIDDEADLRRRMTFARNQGLMRQVLVAVGRQAMTEDAIRKAYDEVVVKPVTGENELHLRHLIVFIKDPTDDAAVKAAEGKAMAALERINKGEDFAAVAADVSEDPVTKAKGGDYGWTVREMMIGEYADVAFKMKPGEVSPLIRTGVGWHIVKLEDQRPRKPVEYEKLRDRIANMVSNNAQLELVDKIRAEAKIERLDQPNAVDKGAPTVK